MLMFGSKHNQKYYTCEKLPKIWIYILKHILNKTLEYNVKKLQI